MRAYQRKMGVCPLRLQVMVASLVPRYSTSRRGSDLTWAARVMTTPHGMGHPMNLWPDTDTELIGLVKEMVGAPVRKGSIVPERAASQWM
jgi:hypothetical protein